MEDKATLRPNKHLTADAYDAYRALVKAARNMMREWIAIVGDETENSTPADTLEKLRAALETVEQAEKGES